MSRNSSKHEQHEQYDTDVEVTKSSADGLKPLSDDTRDTHPSFGMVSITRYQGDTPHFGSSTPSFSGLTLEIKGASRQRGLSQDWINGTDTKIRISLSNEQYVDLISTAINTSGVPCTIQYDREHGLIAPPNEPNRSFRAKTVKDFKDTIDEYTDKAKESEEFMKTLLNKKGSITKKELHELNELTTSGFAKIKSSMPFILDSFNEDMDKLSIAVKQEVLHSEIVRNIIEKGESEDLQLLGENENEQN